MGINEACVTDLDIISIGFTQRKTLSKLQITKESIRSRETKLMDILKSVSITRKQHKANSLLTEISVISSRAKVVTW